MVGGGFVRTNYRITGKRIDPGAMKSMIVVDSYYDSFSDFVTVSMGGYGYPSALMVIGVSALSGALPTGGEVGHRVMPTQSFSGSCGWIYVYESTQEMTGTARILFAGIIGSR